MSPNPRSTNGGDLPSDPIDAIEREHQELMEICDLLEAIADRVREQHDPPSVRSVAERLRSRLSSHHQHEEQLLFPLLVKRASSEDHIEEIVASLLHDNAMDEGYALEVLELLDILARGQRPKSTETAGYMLRGFFEGLRRHLRCERVSVFKLARLRLTNEDKREMSERIRNGMLE